MSRLATGSRRNRFVLLRTAGSPPVALHHASQHRSYLRLPGYDMPGRGLPPRRQRILTDALIAGLVPAIHPQAGGPDVGIGAPKPGVDGRHKPCPRASLRRGRRRNGPAEINTPTVIHVILRNPQRCALFPVTGDALPMQTRFREPLSAGRPTPSWLAGIMIGLTVSTLATGAMMLGAGMAISKSVTKPK